MNTTIENVEGKEKKHICVGISRNICVVCGVEVPEGREVCPICEMEILGETRGNK